MKCCLCVFVVLIVVGDVCYAKKPVFTIGALFHEDEADLQMAFRHAIQRRNLNYNDMQFKLEVQTVLKADTFATHKILCNWTSFEDGLVGIFGPTSPKTSCMAQSIAETLEIPHMQVHWKPSKPFPDSHQTTINYFPDQNKLSMGIATVVRHLEWKTYVILYENQESLIRLQEVLKLAHRDQDPVTMRQLEGDDFRPIFKAFKTVRVYHFIIDCSVKILGDVLKHAEELGFLDYVYSFLLTNLDSHTVNIASLNSKANITALRILDPENRSLKNMVYDWEFSAYRENKELAIQANTTRTELALMDDAVTHFTEAISNLYETEQIYSKPLTCDGQEIWDSGITIASYMKVHSPTHTATGNMSFDYISGKRINFILEIVEYVHGYPEKSCEWYPLPETMHTLNCTRSEGKKLQSVLESLQKELVIVSSRIGEPYLLHRLPSSPGEVLTGNARYQGYSLDLIDALANTLNFTYEFRLAKDNAYGSYRKEIKSWDGLIKDLLDRKAHLAICDLTITHDRRAVVDFSMPFMTLGIGILYSKAKESETALFAFMDPLEAEVWIYIVTFYMSTTLAMYIITRMAPGDWENPHPCDQNPEELENIWTLKNCLWLILGSTMSQGCDILPKGISSRMATSMWWFFILIINSSYTANLAAFLTKDRMGAEIDSADALAAQTKVKYGTVEGGSTQGFFRESNNKIYQKMWTTMSQSKPSVFEENNQSGVKRVLNAKNQGYAFLMETSQIEFAVERNCDLKQVGTRLDSKGYGIAMPMNSPYRSAINKAVLKLQEDGTLSRLKTKWWKEELGAGKCDSEDKSAGTAATASWNISNVRGVFMVLGIGVGIAFIFSMCEFLWNVREVSLQEHITFYEAFKIEFKFAINIWVTEKRVKPVLPEPKNDESEERSIAHKVLHGASSILRVDVLDKILKD